MQLPGHLNGRWGRESRNGELFAAWVNVMKGRMFISCPPSPVKEWKKLKSKLPRSVRVMLCCTWLNHATLPNSQHKRCVLYVLGTCTSNPTRTQYWYFGILSIHASYFSHCYCWCFRCYCVFIGFRTKKEWKKIFKN